MENPATHIIAQVPASASGTVMPAAIVAAARRRNKNTTSITRPMVANSVSCMSLMLPRMVPVRSERTEMSTSVGIQRLSSGNSSRMRSTVSMTLESLALVITSSTEGARLYQPKERLLRTPGSIEAMAESLTTVPFVVRTTIGSYSPALRS